MRASTQVSVACVELRCTDTPATETSVWADGLVVRVSAAVRGIEQLPGAPRVEHGVAVVTPPGPESSEKLICVPAGAFVTPEPPFTSTCPVKTRDPLTRSVPPA